MTKTLERQGWVKIPGVSKSLLPLAFSLGTPVPSRTGGLIIDHLRPLEKSEAHPRSLSALFGKEILPFHTDGAHHRVPPRFLILSSRSRSNCPTLLKDSKNIPETTADELIQAVFLVSGARLPFYTSLLSMQPYRFKYDAGCMEIAHPRYAVALNRLQDFLKTSQATEVYWEADDVVVVDNWRMLHGRADASQEPNRCLTRVLVQEANK